MRIIGKQSIGLCSTLFLAVIGLAACTGGGIKETFTLAWSDTKGGVHVQYSEDGVAWKDAVFPSTFKTVVGVGVAADPVGVEYLLIGQAPNGDRIGVFSLGPDGYIIRPPDVLANNSVGLMDTGPAMASSSLERWYLAYRSGKNVKVAYLERVSEDKLGSVKWKNTWKDETPMLNVNNTAVQGWPSLSIKGTRVVVSWFRQPTGGTGELQMAIGDLQPSGSIKWLGGQVFPNSEPNVGGVELEHDLCNDGKHFILGVTREDVGVGATFKSYGLYLYKSVDGMKWTLEQYVGMKNPAVKESFHHASPLGISANSKGVIVVAESSGGVGRVWRFDKQWAKSSKKVFSGYPASNKHFSLISNVQP